MKKTSRRRRDNNAGPAMFSVTGDDLQARREQRLRTLALLKTARTPLQVIQIGVEAEALATQAMADAARREPPRRPLACAEGCSWCCHKRVGVAIPEVARIAEYLRAILSASQIEATLGRISDTLEHRRRTQVADGAACPLLVDNRCIAYPVRPLTCRGFNSSDPAPCRASVTDDRRAVVPVYPPQLRLTSLVLDGVRAGLMESGLRGEVLELAAALKVALCVPDAITRWLTGEPVFGAARLP